MITLPALAALPARPATQPDTAADAATDVEANAGGGFAAALQHAREPTKAPTDGKARTDAKGAADGKTRAGEKGNARPSGGAEPKTDNSPEAPAEAASDAVAAPTDTTETINTAAPDLSALLPGWTPAQAPAPALALTPPPVATKKLAVPAAATHAAIADPADAAAPSLPGPVSIQALSATGEGVRLATTKVDESNSELRVAAADVREAPTAAMPSRLTAVPDQPLAASRSAPAGNEPALSMQAAKDAAASVSSAAPSLPATAMPLALPSLQATPQLSLHALASVAPPPFEARLAAAIDMPGFAPALTHQITWLASEGVQHARLTLNPAEMGPLAVRIVLDGTQARIDFSVDMPATRSAIEASLPTLAAALNDSGLTLAGGGVFDGHARRGTPDGQPAKRAGAGTLPGAGTSAEASLPLRSTRGLIDLVA